MPFDAAVRNSSDQGSGVFPTLVFVQGNEQHVLNIDHTPFSVGRKVDKDLVIADPRVSRDHALITSENGSFCLVDQGSKHGTFVNGVRIERKALERNDRLEFGVRDTVYVIFNPQHASSNSAREFLSQISRVHISDETTDLEKLVLFLQAARKLNTIGVLDEILMSLLEVTLKLTRAERAYVFLKNTEGTLRLSAGRNSAGEPLLDDKTISHSILEDALKSNSEFVLTDTSRSLDLSGRQSIVAYDLRTVICVPLRKPQVQATRENAEAASLGEAMGALYVDSRFASRDISSVSNDILHAIATEAASLIENARLVQAEEAGRRYQQELSIAASIQQRIMAVTIPEVPFASLACRNLSCKEIGGDFYDAVMTDDGLAVVLADVSGKGVSAALLASTLQGMIYSQLTAGMGLTDLVTAVNRFFTHKHIGEKYATLVIVRIRKDGDVEFVNCGHILPLLVSANHEVRRLPEGNVPVGLLSDAQYESARCRLVAGDRLILVTDGVTEAENARGDFFEDHRLEAVAREGTLEDIFRSISSFCGGAPLNDDCTVVELLYTGDRQNPAQKAS